MRYLPAIALPVILAILAYAVNVPAMFGAHPWWSQTVILIGVPLGIGLAAMSALLPIDRLWRLGAMIVLALASLAIAIIGKIRFAASYAEDTLAGQMWYFGWIALCCFAAAVIAKAVWPERRRD